MVETRSITKIDVLVKPGSTARDDTQLLKNPLYRNLYAAWNSRIKQVVEGEGIVLYFSELNQGIIDGNISPHSQWDRQELKYMKNLSKIYDHSIIQFGFSDYPSQELILKALEIRRLAYEPKKAQLGVYGEHTDERGTDLCVAVWGNLVRQHLSISIDNYTCPIPGLSLSTQDASKLFR